MLIAIGLAVAVAAVVTLLQMPGSLPADHLYRPVCETPEQKASPECIAYNEASPG